MVSLRHDQPYIKVDVQTRGVMQVNPIYAVIPARNVEDSLPNVLHQLKRSGVMGCIVVVNGSSDRTMQHGRRYGAELGLATHLVEFDDPLGPDVPRAVGAYAAVRSGHGDVDLVFVDGDWKGAFGPALSDFLVDSTGRKADVAFVGSRAKVPEDRPDLALWRQTLQSHAPCYAFAHPSQGPVYVRSRTFQSVSRYELYHPGRWFAWCVRAAIRKQLSVHVCADWYTTIVGNPTRDAEHIRNMRATLIGDAAEGCSIVKGTVPSRRWKGRVWDGYHPIRRVDLLAAYASRWRAVGE